jgi:hypothetical protein
MFNKLFGAKEKKIDPKEQKIIEQKKTQFEIKKAKEDLDLKIDQNQNKMEGIERQIRDKTKVG